MPYNKQRGELNLVLGGEPRRLCLTLGALAELESNLADEDLIQFTERLTQGNIKAQDLIHLLGAALRGGGEELSDEKVAELMPPGGFGEAVEIAARLIAVAFGGQEALQSSSNNKENKKKLPFLGRN